MNLSSLLKYSAQERNCLNVEQLHELCKERGLEVSGCSLADIWYDSASANIYDASRAFRALGLELRYKAGGFYTEPR